MKTSNLILILAASAIVISSCKKKEEPAPATPAGPTAPTTNYYIFDGVTYTGNLGAGTSLWFKFYCSNVPGGGGDKEINIYFKAKTSPPWTPAPATYTVTTDVGMIDSSNCFIQIENGGNTYYSAGGGSVTVGSSGTETTYIFSDVPLLGNKKVTGNFIF